MKKKIQHKLYSIIIVLTVFVFIFPLCISKAVPTQGATDNDKEKKASDSQVVIDIPTDIIQINAQEESATASHSARGQVAVQNMWREQGSKADEDNWAYVEIGGQRFYLVALTETFGHSGDFVDIYINNNGQEKIYNCLMGDEKRNAWWRQRLLLERNKTWAYT